MKKKRWLSILLSLSLLLTLLPAQAFAEEGTDGTEIACTQTSDCPAQVHEPDCPLWQEDSTDPDETGLNETVSGETGLNETGPDESAPEETGPGETVLGETAPGETGPEETGPDESAPDESAPDETGTNEPAEPSQPEETQPTALEQLLALAATLPDPAEVTADNADEVTSQLQAFTRLYAALTADEQESDEAYAALARVMALQSALDALTGEDSGPALLATIENVAYVDATYNEGTNTVTYTNKTAASATVVDSSTTTWSAGWYVVSEDVTISDRITVSGDVHLILADGKTLNAEKGITVNSGSSLTIYGQADGTGKLTTGTPDSDYAGIGGHGTSETNPGNSGAITINGGVVKATGSRYTAGIGGGYKGAGAVTINGGVVSADGGYEGAGIGSGFSVTNGTTVTIHGGTVMATGGESAAGIGSGYSGGSSAITISGGNVTATGGEYGAGIGGSYSSGNPTITISGGTVKAAGGKEGAGIGGGSRGSSGTITISGGFVAATGGAKSSVRGAGASIGSGSQIVNKNGTETTDSNFTNCVVMKGAVGSMTGTVYGTPTLTTDATVPSGATLTVPENSTLIVANGATLTLNSGSTMTNNDAIYVEEGATFYYSTTSGGDYGILTNNGTLKTDVVPVRYEAYEDGQFVTKTVYDYTVVTDQTTWGTAYTETWYVVNSETSLTIASRIIVRGDVHLILADGKTLTASAGINVPVGSSLTIYGQTEGTGKLSATGGTNQAGIGGNSGSSSNTTGNSGSIIINGGTVEASAGGGAGIGGGQWGTGSVTIHGGTVTATSTGYGAGIGGGVYAKGSVTITGGTVTASGGTGGAGIGNGARGTQSAIDPGTISITGGFVTATGGSSYTVGNGSYGAGAAIGSGSRSGTNGTETAETSFTNAVVLRKSTATDQVMTGQVYGEPTLDTNATVPSGATLTIPEGTSLTVGANTTLTNSGAICMEGGSLLYGDSYGTLTNGDNGKLYYLLTVEGGTATATEGMATYNDKTYAVEGATVTLTPDTKVGQTFNNTWTASPTSANVTFSKVEGTEETAESYQFTMPAQVLTVTAGYENAPTYTVTIPASVSIGDTATAAIEAESVNVAEGYNLNVKLTATSDANNAFTLALKENADVTLGYTMTLTKTMVKLGTGEDAETTTEPNSAITVSENPTVLTIPGGTADSSGSSTLTFAMADQLKKYSGTYTGTVTFTVSVDKASTP